MQPPILILILTAALLAAAEKKSVTIETPSGEVTFKEATISNQKDFSDKVTELTSEERLALDQDFNRVPGFIAAFVSPEQRTGDALEDLDLAFAAWLRSSERDAFDEQAVIRIVGSAVGARAIEELGVRWARVTDALGSSIALVSDDPPTRSYPFTSVQYRIEDKEVHFVAGLFRTLGHAMNSVGKPVAPKLKETGTVTAGFRLIQVLAGVALVLLCLAFDALLREIHERHHDRWVSMGSPPGFFWVPPGASWLKGINARQRLIGATWFRRPDWLRSDPVLSKLWRRMTVFAVFVFLMPILLLFHEKLPF